MYKINVDAMGRGIQATTDIKAGTVIEVCDLLILSEKDTKTVNTTELHFYTFYFNKTQDCLVLGCGELFNHSDDNVNVEYKLGTLNSRPVMIFTATKDIKTGYQLFIDYQADTVDKLDTQKYLKNKSLMN
jgi:hypothetical protein